MRHLNYNHLYYFWHVLREGSVSSAAELLHVTPQTVSGQIKTLEQQLGGALFQRDGRRLVPTDFGRDVYDYAREMFVRGEELREFVYRQRRPGAMALRVGVSNVIPKLVAARVIGRAYGAGQEFTLSCSEGSLEELLGRLVSHRLDVVIADHLVEPPGRRMVRSELLDRSPLDAFGTPELVARMERPLPAGLDGMPVLMPSPETRTFYLLQEWFSEQRIRPVVVAEFDDSALLKAFGEQGLGIFFAPGLVAEQASARYRVERIGEVSGVEAKYFALTTPRVQPHPGVLAMLGGGAGEAGVPA